jgi:KipI family sensor histidine kinase inhibitor
VAKATGRSPEAVIEALCANELRVFLLGFLPGFPYLGELPEWLRLPRRATPRSAVPANSLAIAGAQAAIYPWVSPGGWHLLGPHARAPVRPGRRGSSRPVRPGRHPALHADSRPTASGNSMPPWRPASSTPAIGA